jgi:PAS domain S-box-containing protein
MAPNARMTRPFANLEALHSPVLRYGLAVVTFLAATGLSVMTDYYGFPKVEAPAYLLAIAISAWYAGLGPSILAVVLSILFFDYYFVAPRYSFYVTVSELPYFVATAAFGALIAWFSTVRRRVERDLSQARDHLEIEVQERSQQASLLDLTHDSIFVRNLDFTITYWNQGAHELYGWSAEEALGQKSDTLLKTTFPAPLEEIRDVLERTGRWEGELQRTTAGGSQVVASARWSLRYDSKLQPAAILETSNDITERKHREKEIENLNHELTRRSGDLETANKELEAFAYSVSHDLRAPLRHMSGYGELLQKKSASVLDEKCSHYLAMILESARRMGNLIDDLLAFSRVGRAETQKTLVNLEQLVREVINEVRQDAPGREISWQVSPLPSFYGDRSMIRLVLVNLLTNAIKFTRPRSRAEIEVGSAGDGGGDPAVFVRDNGVGFDMKYANKLFGVFQRLHQSDAFEGTGIGLATVQRIVLRHGGKVWAEGAVDRGATFYFSLPKPRG